MKGKMKTPVSIPVTKLHTFEGHPYKVRDDAEMETLQSSIEEYGILSPLIVRPMEGKENEYEVVSGHRRLHAAQKAGIGEVPAFVHDLDRDAAAVLVVDSNLHREHLLPSEKAFAYKMKFDAMQHQGKRTDLSSSQLEPKLRTDEQIGMDTGESRATVQRYIRLTNLVPELLDWMDEGKVALSVGVELSYLSRHNQYEVLEQCRVNDCTPSYSQAVRLHRAEREYGLDAYDISTVLQEEKANQRQTVKVPVERLRNLIPESFTVRQAEDYLVKAAEYYYRYLQRQRSQSR